MRVASKCRNFLIHRQPATSNQQPAIMRWFPFFILAYVVLGVQLGLSGYVDVYRAQPNFVLLAAVFVAVNAQRDAALLGCFLLGLMQDLLTQSPLGLTAFSYGLIGMFVVSTQEIVYREHFLTHLSLGFAGGLIYAFIVFAHGLLYPLLHASRGFLRPSLGPLFAGAVYTAILAPLLMYLLQRMRKPFGFRPLRASRK